MKKETAEFVKREVLSSVSSLSSIINKCEDELNDNEFEIIKKKIGLLIGKLQMDLLEPIYTEHPELDDL